VPAATLEPPHGTGDGPISARPWSRHRPARQGSGRTWWRGRAAIVLASIVLVAGGGLALILALHGAAPKQPSGSHAGTTHPGTGQELAAEAAARTQAVAWILQQVSRAAVVSCDPQVCTDLAGRHFPSANLLTLGPESTDPLGSALVVATATVRNQFGSHLAVYAPAIIASFGAGNARIDIRWAYPGGAKAYRAALPAALRVRKAADAQLLTNSNIGLSATARAQLLSGQVDPRLPLLIVIMAHSHPLRIVDFASKSPGGGPASLLRSVDLATADGTAHLTRTAYLAWMNRFIGVQRAQYRPAWSRPVTLGTGQAVLRIGYDAPSPLS